TCRIVRERAVYPPARDAAGRPVRGRDSGRVTWRLPADLPAPPPAAPPLLPPGTPGAHPYPIIVASPPPPPSTGVRPNLVVPPQRARANLNTYFSMDDYPAAAVRNHHEGTTGFRLRVGTDGRVADCQVSQPSGSALLDAATCRILRARARYNPARAPD